MTTSIKTLLAGLFFIGLSHGLLAQNYTGIVHDEKHEPLVGAYVTLIGVRMPSTSTDANGEFSIAKVSEADSLLISFVGYEDLRITATDEHMYLELVPSGNVEIDEAKVEAEQVGTRISLLDPLDSEVLTTVELCKAACCNLSEAFETNASIDASFTDAVTGTRQIQMLGLSGKYVQITQDNIPAIRGLSTIYGLSRIPGTWINEIYISKGAGSVTSGFESLTGQINVATFNPETAKSPHLNMYANAGGRVELNAYAPVKVNNKWSSIFMIHSERNNQTNDVNNDGFYDMPQVMDLVARNSWLWRSGKGWNGDYSINYVNSSSNSGEIKGENRPDPWEVELRGEHISLNAKTGYVWPEKQWQSVGSQFSGGYNVQRSAFGDVDYEGIHQYFRGNVLYSCKQTDTWSYTVGGSIQYDNYEEQMDTLQFDRLETVPGVFFENTWTPGEKFTIVSGVRGDYHNMYGVLFSPRVHARWMLKGDQAIKLAVGIGHRSPVIIMDNIGLLASNREFNFPVDYRSDAYGLDIETAVNVGLSYTNKFKLSYRPAMFSVDFYRTQFTNQVIVDRETPGEVSFYNLEGESYSNSFQVEFKWEPFKRLETRFAYRYLDVKADFNEGLITPPLIPEHRLFNNTAYKTKEGKNGRRWLFDVTTLWTSSQRLPLSGAEELDQDRTAEDYFLVNSQITRDFSKHFSFYVGVENLLDFRQNNPIISAENTNSELFDSSVIWAPIFGRTIYTGFRWNIGAGK
ncbi:MAG: carboxypeptidase-like regulatory domain-containing protein [Flavobacteriales bacterium]